MRIILPIFDTIVEGITAFFQGTPTNWRLGAIREPFPHGTPQQQKRLLEIFSMAKRAGIKTLYGPDPHRANAEIMTVSDQRFRQSITLPRGKEMKLVRGPEADAEGMILPKDTGLWLIPADCSIFISVDILTGLLIAVHAGRDSLIDRQVLTGGDPRRYFSVVDNVMKKFKEAGSKIENLRFWSGFSIDYRHFDHPPDHPLYGPENRALIKLVEEKWPQAFPENDGMGKLSLQVLTRLQLMDYGVTGDQVFFDKVDTYGDLERSGPRMGEYAFWSARREREEKEKGSGIGNNERNGVLIVNRGVRPL